MPMTLRHSVDDARVRSLGPTDRRRPTRIGESTDERAFLRSDVPPRDFLVESETVAVLTRFGLRRRWHLLQTYLAYRWLLQRVRRTAPDGLLNSVFLVENATTCWSLSLWANESAIPHFGTSVMDHVSVARDVFGRLRFHNGYPEIWSTKWRLHRASNNLNWKGCDLGPIGVRQTERRDDR